MSKKYTPDIVKKAMFVVQTQNRLKRTLALSPNFWSKYEKPLVDKSKPYWIS